jgi:hypothetical protein
MDRLDKLERAGVAFGRSNELQPAPATKTKYDQLTRMIAEERAMAKVNPVA